MREMWRIGGGLDLRVTGQGELPPPGGDALHAHEAIAWVRWARGDGPRGHEVLLEMAEALSGFGSTPRASPDAALQIVERGLADGRLRAYVVKNVEGGGKAPERVNPPPPPPPPPPDNKTFIAIQLITDEPEPKPVPFKRYRIELPDSSIREGQLDQFGKAQVSGIDPGTCKVSFPDLDGGDWKAA